MATADKIYIEGRSRALEAWESMESYYEELDHPLWKTFGDTARKRGGHGGGDWLELYRLINALQTGTLPDMDVYDAATSPPRWLAARSLPPMTSEPRRVDRLARLAVQPRPAENTSIGILAASCLPDSQKTVMAGLLGHASIPTFSDVVRAAGH